MRPDDMLETFIELAVKVPDLMRLVLQACVAAMVNVQSVEAVDTELKRRAVVGNYWGQLGSLSPTTSPASGTLDKPRSASTAAGVRLR